MKTIETLFTDLDDTKYPHAWRGAVICFVFGLGLMVLTDLFALLTVCCRRCICCSVFTICGSIQSFASILFTLGKPVFLFFVGLAELYVLSFYPPKSCFRILVSIYYLNQYLESQFKFSNCKSLHKKLKYVQNMKIQILKIEKEF